uniref:Uncharacterized protein n=1 Tax=Arundo donax TaxID=35708 RepID=A0A0A9ABI9_ARUDO
MLLLLPQLALDNPDLRLPAVALDQRGVGVCVDAEGRRWEQEVADSRSTVTTQWRGSVRTYTSSALRARPCPPTRSR